MPGVEGQEEELFASGQSKAHTSSTLVDINGQLFHCSSRLQHSNLTVKASVAKSPGLMTPNNGVGPYDWACCKHCLRTLSILDNDQKPGVRWVLEFVDAFTRHVTLKSPSAPRWVAK